MKKDQNSLSESGQRDQTLSRPKILRGKRNFRRLFEQSTVVRSAAIHFRYRLYDDPAEGCLIGFIVKTKLGKAAKRNRMKRLLREVYRAHQYILADLFESQVFGFHGAFLAQTSDLTYQTAEKEMVPILKDVRNQLMKQVDRRGLKMKTTDNTDNDV